MDPATTDASARATLDGETGQITLPLSEYDLLDDPRDIATLNFALNIFIGQCMSEKGFAYSAATVSDVDRLVDDRSYGIWFEPGAREYGFGFAPSDVDVAMAADAEAGGQLWIDTQLACSVEAETDPTLSAFMPTNEIINGSLISTIRTDSYRLASADQVWQSAREKWWSCLREKGLDPLTGANDWGTKQDLGVEVGSDGQPRYTEESIRVAFMQAECNNSTGLAQTLGNLEASYQAPMIEKNQAALNDWKEDKQARLAAAMSYINSHG